MSKSYENLINKEQIVKETERNRRLKEMKEIEKQNFEEKLGNFEKELNNLKKSINNLYGSLLCF